MNTLQRLFSKKNLLDAWDEHKASFPKRTMAGVDGVSRTDFAETIEQQVEDISAKVRFEAFGFSRLRPVAIPMGQPQEKPKTVLLGPNDNVEFLGIQIVRTMGSPIVLRVPVSSRIQIENSVLASCEIDFDSQKKQKNWLLVSANKANNLVRNYRGAYGFCENWPQFEESLKQLRVNMCRRIARQLASVEKNQNSEMLLRLFGI